MLKRKDLLGLYDLSAEEIDEILTTGASMKKLLRQNIKKLPHLQGRSVTTLFYENSTRTRCSFELAAKYMGAHAVNIAAESSSVKKGETLVDTGKTLDAMKNDVIVIRHPMGGRAAPACKHGKSARGERGRRHERTPFAGAFRHAYHARKLSFHSRAYRGDLGGYPPFARCKKQFVRLKKVGRNRKNVRAPHADPQRYR